MFLHNFVFIYEDWKWRPCWFYHFITHTRKKYPGYTKQFVNYAQSVQQSRQALGWFKSCHWKCWWLFDCLCCWNGVLKKSSLFSTCWASHWRCHQAGQRQHWSWVSHGWFHPQVHQSSACLSLMLICLSWFLHFSSLLQIFFSGTSSCFWFSTIGWS